MQSYRGKVYFKAEEVCGASHSGNKGKHLNFSCEEMVMFLSLMNSGNVLSSIFVIDNVEILTGLIVFKIISASCLCSSVYFGSFC